MVHAENPRVLEFKKTRFRDKRHFHPTASII
jgi:hypothetical protein